MTEPSWMQVVADLRNRHCVPAAQANADLLEGAGATWTGRVVPRTSMPDLLFTRPGEGYPFEEQVRVVWADEVFTFTLQSERGRMVTADRARPANAGPCSMPFWSSSSASPDREPAFRGTHGPWGPLARTSAATSSAGSPRSCVAARTPSCSPEPSQRSIKPQRRPQMGAFPEAVLYQAEPRQRPQSDLCGVYRPPRPAHSQFQAPASPPAIITTATRAMTTPITAQPSERAAACPASRARDGWGCSVSPPSSMPPS